jgi:sedoheptulose-bisphosphatase
MGGEGFSVAFDPLDGSSIVDTNFAVGTIVGIWPGDKLTGITGREQVCDGQKGGGQHVCTSRSGGSG